MAKDSELWGKAYAAYKGSRKSTMFSEPKTTHKPVQKESMVLQRELLDVNNQLKELKKRRKSLIRQLTKSGQRIIQESYFNTTIKLYALRLEEDCWYIGMSRNPERRFKKHGTNKGAQWTRLFLPIEIAEIRDTGLLDDAEACRMEDDMTIEYAMKYGSDKVRGGGYCQRKPRWPDVIIQNELAI